ncbi:MAG: hypothetical protein ACYTGP_12630 [Planctomycetota bacterium]|jgi:hypothetical protein
MIRSASAIAVSSLVALLAASPALAVDELLEDDFIAPDFGGWGGGSESYSNPGADGVGGAADGFLRVANDLAPSRLAVRNADLAYGGDYAAAGVRRVMFYVNDVDDADPELELHFGIGTDQSNFWLLNEPLVLAAGEWRFYVIDLENADFNDWSQIGFGAQSDADFQAALANVGRVLIRHDDYADGPDGIIFNDDFIAADFGLDRFMIVIDCQSGAITGPDCNTNGQVDECDIGLGVSLDENANGVPDECEGPIVGDLNGDGVVDILDLLDLLAQWGDCPDPPDPCPGDLDLSGDVGINDLLILLANWT